MSIIGSPNAASLVQAAQAQQTASKARDKERAATQRTQRSKDEVELHVDGLESAEAVKSLPENDSEQARQEHRSQPDAERPDDDDDHAPIDVTA